jgi:hypothetical protein
MLRICKACASLIRPITINQHHAFAGALYRVGGDNECRDVEPRKMRLQGRWISKLLVRVRCEAGDDWPGVGSVAQWLNVAWLTT